MVFDLSDCRSDAYGFPPGIHEQYEPSIASSASSSQSSVFSESLSAQSSIASSISDDFRVSSDDVRERDRICAQAQLRCQAQHHTQNEQPSVLSKLLEENDKQHSLSYADVTSAAPVQGRQHLRRCSVSQSHKPPALTRQRDRKINFVDNLVDSATQMVEVIWPLSAVPCTVAGNSRSVLPLRNYIEETLRRSRTSYSTLQVALYYLILIKPHVPHGDFTRELSSNCSATRALMCGRRMFLAALILASKYLQDRNYSAKAWSKMSGLRANEINANERVFLGKIGWKLHIPKPTFETWQEIVIRYTPQPQSPVVGFDPCALIWKNMIPLLTPELDNVPMTPSASIDSLTTSFVASPATPRPSSQSSVELMSAESRSEETTPTPATVLPRFLEYNPSVAPPTPLLARMGPLPTPQMTPSSVAASTPAASACPSCRSSMCSAMAIAQKTGFNRSALDVCPTSNDFQNFPSRRPSMSVSTWSSPESTMSDNSRSSRSSSICSVSTVSTNSSLAPNRVSLARLATCRNVRLPPTDHAQEIAGNNAVSKPVIVGEDAQMVSSPEMADFSISDKALHAPHRHSKRATHNPPATSAADKGRKRCRSSGHHRRSELQEEVRFLLQETLDDDDDDEMDIDYFVASPSSAADEASSMLARGASPAAILREAQPPATLTRGTSYRVPVQSANGKKRTCLSSQRVIGNPRSRLYGEVSAQ